MKRLIQVVLLLIIWCFPPSVGAQGGAWVEVLHDGAREPLQPAYSVGCRWDFTVNSLINLPGECGRPVDATNVFMVVQHNLWCDKPGPGAACHFDRNTPGYAWGALVPGDPVSLFDGRRLWRGVVMEVIRNAGAAGVEPQTEFPCPRGWVCGTLTTCAGLRPEYVVVRVKYR